MTIKLGNSYKHVNISAVQLILAVVLLIICFSNIAFADTITQKQASQMVQTWLSSDRRPLKANLPQQIKEVQTYCDDDGNPEYYIVNMEPSGFVIVSAEDITEPVIGFVSDGTYEPSDDNPLTLLIKSDLPNRVQEARNNTKSALKKNKKFTPTGRFLVARQKWNRLLGVKTAANAGGSAIASSGTALSVVSDVRVSPFIQSKWSQMSVAGNAVYNYYTPTGSAGSASNDPCGCVATAMAQLMRYYQYPTSGVGSLDFYYSVNGTIQGQKALNGGDGSGGPYNWSDMVLVPDSNTTLAQRQAIGALCSDAGLASSSGIGSSYCIDYGSSSTSAVISSNELVQVFKYGNAIMGYNNGSDISYWLKNMINPNLDAGLPVLLGIYTTTQEGHAILADGYGYDSSTLYHHLNLGWGGYSDAWYNLPNISAGGYTFNAVDACIYNVYTSGSGEIISGRVTDSSGNPIGGATVTAQSSKSSSTTTNSNGIYAFTKVQSGRTYTISVQCQGYTFSSQTATTGRSYDGYTTCGNVWGINFTGTGGPQVTSFAINNGSTSTAALNVTLNNSASGSPTQYIASESSSFSGASWQSYSTSPSFTLSSGGGVKTVYFKVKNSSGTESAVVSDTISVDSTLPVSSVLPTSKIFKTAFYAALTASKSATIYYTTNGSIPTTSSNVYSTPVLISADTKLKFFAVDSVGNVENSIKEADYYLLTDDGSIADAKKLANGDEVRLGGKALYYLNTDFGYIEEPDRFSGIRVQGNLLSSAGYIVDLIGNIVKLTDSEPYIQTTVMDSENAGTVKPLAANNKAISVSLMDGLYVTAWGLVQSASVNSNSYVISDGSPDNMIKVVTAGTPSVKAGDFVTVTGAAGLVDGARVIYSN